MKKSVDKTYKNSLSEEAQYWGQIASDFAKKGIIHCDFDMRRAQQIQDPTLLRKYGTRKTDPLAEDIWRGYVRDRTLHLAKQTGGKILELGCGAGWLSLELGRCGLDVEAIDISPERIRIAKQMLEDNPFTKNFGSVKYRIEDLNSIVLQPNHYDVIISFTTLHHLSKPNRLINQVYNSLKPNGLLIIYDDAKPCGSHFLRMALGAPVNIIGQMLPSYVPPKDRIIKCIILVGRSLLPPNKWNWGVKVAVKLGMKAPESPLEGSSHGEYIDEVRSLFNIVEERYFDSFHLKSSLNLKLSTQIRKRVLRMFHFIDNIFANTKILRGAMIYLVIRKSVKATINTKSQIWIVLSF